MLISSEFAKSLMADVIGAIATGSQKIVFWGINSDGLMLCQLLVVVV